ncbi:MAG: hypothetical protein ACREQN_13305 [Candidatus Binataceae bacterium]
MRKLSGAGVMVTLLAVALVSGGVAYGQGFGHGHGHGALVPWPVHHMVSSEQAHAVMAKEKDNLKSAYQAVHAARQKLVEDLVANNNTADDVSALETAQNALLQEKVKVAGEMMSGLSSAQRQQASKFLNDWNSLRQTQRQQRLALFQELGASQGADSTSGTQATVTP